MQSSTKRYAVVLMTIVAVLSPAALANAQYYVVVNPSNPVNEISRTHLAAIFMKSATTWENGAAVIPVDRAASAPVRDAFSKDVYNKPAAAILSYWQQQIFSGQAVPPLMISSDEDVITYIKNNPGAVSYLGAAAPLSATVSIQLRRLGVKAVKVTD